MSRMLSGAIRSVATCWVALGSSWAGPAAAGDLPVASWSGPASAPDDEPIPPPVIPGPPAGAAAEGDEAGEVEPIPPPVIPIRHAAQEGGLVPVPPSPSPAFGDGEAGGPSEFEPVPGEPTAMDGLSPPEDGKAGPPGLQDLVPPDPGLGATPGLADPGAGLESLVGSGVAGEAPGTGGDGLAPEAALPMFGDLSPFTGTGYTLGGRGVSPMGLLSRAAQGAGPIPPPPPIEAQQARINTRARVFKIADNQVPRPIDRVFFTFNHFEDVNDAINRRLNSPVFNMQVQRYVLGFEKTFLDKKASLGLKLPLNVVHADNRSSDPEEFNLTRTSTALGDLFVYSKFLLYENEAKDFLVSGGLAMTLPVGPTTFAGARYIQNPHSFAMQPYLAYYKSFGRFFVIGFEAIDIPINEGDATILFNDVAFGYVLYRDDDPDALVRLVAPVFEAHANIPLSHTDPFDLFDEAGTPDVVNLTYGLNIQLGKRTILSGAFVNPVTGPRPFDFEAMALLNILF